MKRLFNGGWDEIVGFLLHEESGISQLSLFSTWEAFECAVGSHKVFDCLNIETVWVMNSTVIFNNSRNLTAILLKELRCPIAYSAKTLNNESSVLDAFGKTNFFYKSGVACELTNSIVDTKTSRLVTTVDSTLSNKFASAAAFSVNVLLAFNVHVGILDPSHNLLIGTHVRT